jgi:hypothetical protein
MAVSWGLDTGRVSHRYLTLTTTRPILTDDAYRLARGGFVSAPMPPILAWAAAVVLGELS